MSIDTADYLVVGGGLTGSVVAHRLASAGFSVLVLEAGSDPAGNPNVTTPLGGFALLKSNLDWAYKTVPQRNTYNRVHTVHAGKALGGSSTINYGGWLRGDANDYDALAHTVGDQRWSYDGLLPWFRKSETFHDRNASKICHGFEGPIQITSIWSSDSDRRYPLRDPIKQAWIELEAVLNEGHDKGSISGLSEFHENSKNGQRQPSYLAYSLDSPRIDVLTGATVSRVVFNGRTATGVEITDGRQFGATKEIILAAGATRTPQLLLLSGIGSAKILNEHRIPVVHDLPAAGQNLHNHFALFMAFRLKNFERGLAIEKLENPAFFKGLPVDWVVSELEKPTIVQEAINNEAKSDLFARSLLDFPRPLVENMVMYTPAGLPGIPVDGSYISTSSLLLTPTSRGCVTIPFASVLDPPTIDPNYVSTDMDRVGLVHAGRRMLQVMLTTTALGDYIDSETPPSCSPDFSNTPTLRADATDAEILHRIQLAGDEQHHSGGTASMGTVVDPEGKVYGVHGLRVVDASILPGPIGGHPQATLYAMAEQLASMIVEYAQVVARQGET